MKHLRIIYSILVGIAMILVAFVLLLYPHDGLTLVLGFLSLVLIAMGIRQMIQYFTMARYMVGGKMTFYLGLIILDFGFISASMINQSKIYILIYLIGINGFYGVISTLRSFEAKRHGVNTWWIKLTNGIISLVVVVTCFFFIKNPDNLVRIYAIGLTISGLYRIATIFRKEEVVYVQ